MANTAQRMGWISRMRTAAARVALAFVVVLGLVLGATQLAHGQTLAVLHKFTGSDGESPLDDGSLVLDSKGNLYGTTANGGDLNCNSGVGCGVVFKVDPSGTESVLYSFTGGSDGAHPYSGLIRDAANNLYGTTDEGSSGAVVFKVAANGTETVLYTFNNGTEGSAPLAGLIQDAKGNLYGTTYDGGSYGYGNVFKLDTAGTETVLYSFSYGTDGAYPYAGLIRDASGNLYGTTNYGGDMTLCNGTGCGVVFKLDTSGTETVLHTFTGIEGDGAFPLAGLIRDAKGNLYGTTNQGGGYGFGTVFKLSKTGNETVLYHFLGLSDGGYPYTGLARDAKGNLYGTTCGGGAANAGTVFKLSKAGKEIVLHSFSGTDGACPEAGLAMDGKGNLYGATFEGGDLSCNAPYGCGVVFKLAP